MTDRRQRPERSRLKRLAIRRLPPAAVPSFFTLMNLFAGFVAITQIAEGRFGQACWLIVLAGFFDLLDGMMARLTNSQSLFGVELDSLADIVSFGVAPSFLLYTFALSEFRMVGIMIAALPAICGAVRLARFNITFDGEKKGYFSGLPIPMQAACVVALVLNILFWQAEAGLTFERYTWLIPIVILLSGLMVSTIPFDAGPRPTASYIRTHPRKFLLYLIGLVLTLVTIGSGIGLLISLAVYLIVSLGAFIMRLTRAIRQAPPESDLA